MLRADTGCLIAVPIWQQWVSKGEKDKIVIKSARDVQ